MISDKYPNTMRVSEWMKRIDKLENALDKTIDLLTFMPAHIDSKFSSCDVCIFHHECNQVDYCKATCKEDLKEWALREVSERLEDE